MTTSEPSRIVPFHGPLPDEYEIGEVVGRGGMGEVLSVRGPTGARLLLKRIPPFQLTNAVDVERFCREVRTHASLSIDLHGVPQVEGWNDEPGDPYILMEEVPGRSLEEEILGWSGLDSVARQEKAIGITQQLLKTLMQLHELHGLVHRDLSMRNVLVRPSGEICLIDFGIAKDFLQATMLTMSGDRVGTPRYRPPELVLPKSLGFTPRGDLFAVGLLLFEMLCGKPARDGETLEDIQRQVVLEEPSDVRKVAPWVQPETAKFVACLLARNPLHRYSTAGEAQSALDALSSTERRFMGPSLPVFARAARFWRRSPNKTRRRRSALGLSLLSVAALVVGVKFGLPWYWARQAGLSNDSQVALPLLARASSWRASDEILLQGAFSSAAFLDLPTAYDYLDRLEANSANPKLAIALREWLNRASNPEVVLPFGWQQKNSASGLSWIMDTINAAVEENPRSAWLLAWRAWVELSYFEHLKSQSDLAVAKQLAPDAALIRRLDLLGRLGFGSSDRLYPLIEDSLSWSKGAVRGEWWLWKGVLQRRSGRLKDALSSFAHARGVILPGHSLFARLQVEELMTRADLDEEIRLPEVWPLCQDPVVSLLRLRLSQRLGMLSPSSESVFEVALSMERSNSELIGAWKKVLDPSLAKQRVGSMDGADAEYFPLHNGEFRPDFSNWGSLMSDFHFQGSSEYLVLQGGGFSLLPAPDDIVSVIHKSSRIISRGTLADPASSWTLNVEMRWARIGDYGSGLNFGPVKFGQDVFFRVGTADGEMHVESTPGWHAIRIEHKDGVYAYFLDGAEIYSGYLGIPKTPYQLQFSAWAPLQSCRLDVRNLSIKLR